MKRMQLSIGVANVWREKSDAFSSNRLILLYATEPSVDHLDDEKRLDPDMSFTPRQSPSTDGCRPSGGRGYQHRVDPQNPIEKYLNDSRADKMLAEMKYRLIGQVLTSAKPFALPLPLRLLRRLPLLRDLPGRVVGVGVPRVRIDRPQERPPVRNAAQT